MNYVYLFAFLAFLLSCNPAPDGNAHSKKSKSSISGRKLAKFEPADSLCIVFVGQELKALGGLERYTTGYFDYFPHPGGFTMNTKIRPGDKEFGFEYKGLAGIRTTDNWGDGPSNMSLQIADDDFNHSALSIGLDLLNHEGEVARGEQDTLVRALGSWIQSLGRRPVFLRIGYQFDSEWNHYDREDYIVAFKQIRNLFDKMKVTNVAYVWQSQGWGMTLEELESWYPGDKYVDWCGYSYFSRENEAQMIDFARKHKKPVFIAEAAPVSSSSTSTDGETEGTILNHPKVAKEAWEQWFLPFFETIHENPDVIKAIGYINCDWKSHPLWKDNPTFQGSDSRLQLNRELAIDWKNEIAKKKYLNASPELFDLLWGDK